MTDLITKFKSALSNILLFAAGILLVGLGLGFMGMIVLFVLMALGIAMIASPFVTPAMHAPTDAEVVV